MKTAKFIKDLSGEGWKGTAMLYEVNPPMKDYEGKKHKYVICSTVDAMFTGIETLIFPADKEGKLISWSELDGSERGTISHERVLQNAGYELEQ